MFANSRKVHSLTVRSSACQSSTSTARMEYSVHAPSFPQTHPQSHSNHHCTITSAEETATPKRFPFHFVELLFVLPAAFFPSATLPHPKPGVPYAFNKDNHAHTLTNIQTTSPTAEPPHYNHTIPTRLTETARLLRNVRNVFSRRSHTRVNMELELSRE